MKTLVVFYSLEGNTRFVARLIAEKTGADLLELKPEKEPKTRGPLKFFWGGRQVITKKMPALERIHVHPQDYDVLFLGTPVWASNFTPALRTFFHDYELKGKKIALFCTYQGSKGKTLENMKRQLEGNSFIGEMDIVKPLWLQRNELERKVDSWVKSLKDN